MRRAVFFDRDGTLNVERQYLHDPEALEIVPGTGAALRLLIDAGFLLFIITNQSGIGRGYYTEKEMHEVNARLAQLLEMDGVGFEKVYYAPESPEQESPGRKPSPKFLNEAAEEFGVDLRRSFMVGDKIIDLECGWNAGVRRSLLVRTGYGTELEQSEPDVLSKAIVVDNVVGAADWILANA